MRCSPGESLYMLIWLVVIGHGSGRNFVWYFPLCSLCMLMPQIFIMFTLTLVCMWCEEKTQGGGEYVTTCEQI